ncbi:MAG TPA: hypothetical protein PK014_06970 [Thermoanaerobaculia bacterium]|nr:hypothetical protein [Thermoanaerobaculia bacterium]HUM29818.1 hypothetical protein [Thermoanaerobaculia bacterium]HXK68093.1 hypothetical protein [Thermoanaerobaculia bacterium]
MKKILMLSLCVILAMGSTACFKKVIQKFIGGSDQRASSQKEEKSDTAEKSDTKKTEEANPFEAMQEFAKGMKEASEKQQGGEIVVADEATLMKALPDVGGWSRGEPFYSRDAMGSVESSHVEATYEKGDTSVFVKISDSGTMSALLAGARMFMAMNVRHEDSNGYEKVFEFKGHKGYEKWQKADQDGELTYIFDDRYLVEINGSSGVPMETIKDFLGDIDFDVLK